MWTLLTVPFLYSKINLEYLEYSKINLEVLHFSHHVSLVSFIPTVSHFFFLVLKTDTFGEELMRFVDCLDLDLSYVFSRLDCNYIFLRRHHSALIT